MKEVLSGIPTNHSLWKILVISVLLGPLLVYFQKAFMNKVETVPNIKHELPVELIKLQKHNRLAPTRTIFHAEIIRKFPIHKVKYRNGFIKSSVELTSFRPNKRTCQKWAVMTTASEHSEAIRRFTYLENWCIVIVGDMEKPRLYRIPTSLSRSIIFLDSKDQLKMNSEFINALPWKSFGRKNVGYFYAISQGAEVIWDFDDHNVLKFWIEGASVDNNLWIETFAEKQISDKWIISKVTQNSRGLFFNPYPYLGAPTSKCWIRGFPLREITNFSLTQSFHRENISITNIGILQSLADHEPDVDAIYRMTEKIPFNFNRARSKVNDTLVLSKGLYSPMNAQATLHFYRAFFALYLPVTVPGRVSDIWRSYIAQTLLTFRHLHIGYLPRPLVDQDRSNHSCEADFISEIPIYTQTTALVEFLEHWRQTKEASGDKDQRSLEDLMEEIYIGIYERGFIEEADVTNVQLWLGSLSAVNYLTEQKGIEYYNTVAANQINFDVGHSVLFQPNGLPEKCTSIDTKQNQTIFWTSDLHDGSRLDTPSVLASLGQMTYVAGLKSSKTHYPNVFRQDGIKVYGRISKEIMAYKTHNALINDDIIARNILFYQHDLIFKSVDAFVCSFPASMCEFWMPFNQTKSIVFLTAHRYNLGRCNLKSWEKLNDKLKELDSMNKKGHGKYQHVIAAVSRYDYEYLKYYTGITSVELITSFSGFYTQGHPYRPDQSEILVVSHNLPPFMKKITSFKFVDVKKKYPFFILDNLVRHSAVIFFPYSVMSFKLTELYSLNIPLFIPSAKYFRLNGGLGNDRTSTSSPYCEEDPNLWLKMEKSSSSPHIFNPNAEFSQDPEAEMYWLQFSDFYDWPHIQYFDNKEDLEDKIVNTNLWSIHENMKRENEIRRYGLMQKWCEIILRMYETKKQL